MNTKLQEKRDASLAWFSQFQLGCVSQNGVIPEWFHGIISRKSAEEMLQSKPAGYFLIRVGESRIGFTLSYRSEDCCRHFMINVLNNGQYTIVGEDTCHRSLQDLVAFHRRVPILPFNSLLTVACGKASKDKTDYVELFFPQRNAPTPDAFSNEVLHSSNTGQLQPSPSTPRSPPQLPPRTVCGDASRGVASTAVPIQFNPPGLYPAQDTEVAKLTLQSPVTANCVPPVPMPRKLRPTNSVLLEQAPELPSRTFLLHRTEQTDSGPHQLSPSSPASGEVHPGLGCRPPPAEQPRSRGVKSVVANLMQFKKKSLKQERGPEEHIYTEPAEPELPFAPSDSRLGTEPACEPLYQEILEERGFTEPDSGRVHNAGVPAVLTDGIPVEYLKPPPFAPGY
ncbi:hematopoietic SH2 domain-containing protein homolog [Conger conger]|uniref:hematopoietic SH2 domain-containing protein homolog n=1 Tax=Conger conger TaxID=82655 RepID=UPI002A5AAB0A|nr:hematopoietic SH2 domain-containing protein homolog [Conger conger]